MPETQQTQVEVRKRKVPAFLKNKLFIFGAMVFLFILSILVLFFADESNTIRATWGEWANFLFNALKSVGLTYDVSMTTWFLFTLVFTMFFVIFFALNFRKQMIQKKQERVRRKYDRDLEEGEIVKFNVIFTLILVLVFALLIAASIVYFTLTGYMRTIAEQLQDLPNQLLKFVMTLAILIGLIAVVPVAFGLVLLLFKFFITIISLIVSGVSNSVMKSEAYQENMAASQAAAHDIERSMREARGLAKGAVTAAREASNNPGGSTSAPQADILFPALTSIDVKWANKEKEEKVEEAPATTEEAPTTETRPPMDYEQFKLLAFEFQSYLCHQKYYFKINTLRSFIAGLAAARLILLQGLSGTGKSTLPRVFLEYVGGDAYFFPVQATWRDRSDITGYYSDFTGQFKETELLKHLYEASYIPETVNLMVLDEMNISRVEYYFADFLSIFEYPSEDWIVPLMQVKPGVELPKYIENGMVRIPTNTWFVGTVNIDDSTFTITDKVYDRAIAIDFAELNLPFESSYRFDRHPMTVQELTQMFQECKDHKENNLTPAERKKFLELTQFISDTFDVQFGNRIMNQIDNFLPVFVGLGGTKNEALDIMLARKVLRKLDGKFESYIRDGLNKLTRYLNSVYGKHVFPESELAIERYRKKLA